MAGYHIGKFLPTFTYAHLDTTNGRALAAKAATAAAELPQDQYSLTLALAYYVNANIVAKAMGSYVTPLDGSNGLFYS